MVKPYLSRLRPAEPGRLRPRPHSRFEPPPRLPIDSPDIGSLGLDMPPTSPPEAADVEVERSPDPPDPHLTAQTATAVAPGDQTALQARAAAPGPTPPDDERAPARTHAARPVLHSPAPAAMPAGDTGRDPPDLDIAGPAVTAAALADQTGRHVRTGAPGPAALDDERAPARTHAAAKSTLRSPAQATTPAELGSAGNAEGVRASSVEAVGREHTPAQGSGAPHRRADRTSRAADAGGSGVQGDSAQMNRVQAMARWLGHAGGAAATGPAISRQPTPAPADWGPNWPSPAAGHADVTVTIGRIEVKAPAPDPAPLRPRSSGPRQRVPSLSDYLESRTRARGGLR
jgi:hypothetical protein